MTKATGPQVKRSITIEPDLDEYVDRTADELERSYSWVIRKAIAALVANPRFLLETAPTGRRRKRHPQKESA